MKTTLKIEWKYDGEHLSSLEKPVCDPTAALLFLDGFNEAAMIITQCQFEYTATLKVEKSK